MPVEPAYRGLAHAARHPHQLEALLPIDQVGLAPHQHTEGGVLPRQVPQADEIGPDHPGQADPVLIGLAQDIHRRAKGIFPVHRLGGQSVLDQGGQQLIGAAFAAPDLLPQLGHAVDIRSLAQQLEQGGGLFG